MYIYIYIYIFIYVYVYMYIYMYIHIHIYKIFDFSRYVKTIDLAEDTNPTQTLYVCYGLGGEIQTFPICGYNALGV